jgi:NAD-dependent SIR2 family protein deacetylase
MIRCKKCKEIISKEDRENYMGVGEPEHCSYCATELIEKGLL